MNDFEERIAKMIADLKQEYGEMRVRANLAKLEVRDEWHDLHAKIQKLESKTKELGGATADASKDIGAAAKLLGEEIRDGLKDIAKRIG
jgi:uncharacterized coiled-coil DUF342 family protein